MIRVQNLTKQFAVGKGVFNLTLNVERGEVFGFLGPNGAGKSTTIRHLMGFIKPDFGTSTIAGKDCWLQAASVQTMVGYLPGEIAFMENMNGHQFLDLLSGMRHLHNHEKRAELLQTFDVDIKTPIRKLSKGMKQKLGIVAAFMHDPEVLVLDEPTSGLDPLMQQQFTELILAEKARGKTIFFSSHIFQEIERVADRVGIIRQGKLVAIEDTSAWHAKGHRIYSIAVRSESDMTTLLESGLSVIERKGLEAQVSLEGDVNHFISILTKCDVVGIDSRPLSLEDLFMHYYNTEVSPS